MSELKPCKYCGGKPELVNVGDWKQYYAYRCSNCHQYHAKHSEAALTKWGAKRVWNKRSNNNDK